MKDSTKIKLQKTLIVLAGVGAVGGSIALAYMEGRDNGHEAGYREGFEDGKGSDGIRNAYNQGVQDTVKAHRNFVYDPWTYGDCADYVSTNLFVSNKRFEGLLNDEDRAKAEKEVGKDFRCRLVYVAKPANYDDIPHVLPPVDEEPKSIEEQPDVPAVTNENGEEVG